MKETVSQVLFEEFYATHSIPLQPIKTGRDQWPDYEIYPAGNRVAAEVKEFTPNDTDKELKRKLLECGYAAEWGNASERIRHKINEGYKQLKQKTKGSYPALLVLYNNGTFDGIGATDIKNAMYGQESISIKRHSTGTISEEPILGQGRKCTPTRMRSLSGVALLFRMDKLRLSIFHNVHTTCPLPYDWLRFDACRQFSIDLSVKGDFPEWHLV